MARGHRRLPCGIAHHVGKREDPFCAKRGCERKKFHYMCFANHSAASAGTFVAGLVSVVDLMLG
jgi:hypothetical protein